MSSFCKYKSYSHFFFSKNISIFAIYNDQSFNNTLTNNIVSFEQLGPDIYFSYFSYVVEAQWNCLSKASPVSVTIYMYVFIEKYWHFLDKKNPSYLELCYQGAECLALLSSDHEVLDLNSADWRIQLMTVWCFIAQSLLLSPIISI